MDDNDKKDNNDTSSSTSATSIPYVVSCGQRHVLIPKSGHEFPAFLVSIPIPIQSKSSKSTTSASLSSRSADDDDNGNKERKQRQQKHQLQERILVWRSKRDFLLLGRCCGGYSTSTTTSPSSQQQLQQHDKEAQQKSQTNEKKIPKSLPFFPKSSYRKLVDKAPWMRPWSTSTKTTFDKEQDNNNNNNNKDTNNTNNYHPSMKKSIYQLDQFLLYCQQQYYNYHSKEQQQQQQQDKEQHHQEQQQHPWEIFCRPHDTEDLVDVNVNVDVGNNVGNDNNDTTTSCNGENDDNERNHHPRNNNKKNKKRCKTLQTDDVISRHYHQDDDDDDDAQPSISNNNERRERERERKYVSSKLGQYFCSKDNAKQVVTMALNTIPPHILSSFSCTQQQQDEKIQEEESEEDTCISKSCSTNKPNTNTSNGYKLVFLEPSCGYGDVIVELVKELAKRKIYNNTSTTNNNTYNGDITIYGFDIDTIAIKKCKERFSSTGSGNNDGIDDGGRGNSNIQTSTTTTTTTGSGNNDDDDDHMKKTNNRSNNGNDDNDDDDHTKKTNNRSNNCNDEDDDDQIIKCLAKYYNVQFACRNFLETSLLDYYNNPAIATSNKGKHGIKSTTTSTTTTTTTAVEATNAKLNGIAATNCIQQQRCNNSDIDCDNDKMMDSPSPTTITTIIICLGGPPYTSGSGCGKYMQRDLPEQFISHCVTKWNVSTVCFLLPSRYKTFDPTTLVHGYPPPMPPPRPSQLSSTHSSLKDSWIVENVELQSSEFFFQGSLPVIQPSIIQCMWNQNRELS